MKRIHIKRVLGRTALAVLALCIAAQASYAYERIVSLAPSVTEVLYALGLGNKVAGVTNYCDYPPEAERKPKVGGMANPSLEALLALRPDLVILTTNGNPKEFEEKLRSLRVRTYVFSARKISDFPSEVRRLGTTLGVEQRAEALARDTEGSMQRIKSRSAHERQLRALFLVWPEPVVVAGRGSIADEALSLLGLRNIAEGTASEYPKYSLEEIIRQSPDIIFIGKGKGMNEVSEGFLRRLKSVAAVKNNRVYYVGDGLYRLGPRTMAGVEELSAIMKKGPR